MSTGGIFTLITNDGKQDRMLMATELLKARLRRIMKARSDAGMEPTPTLVDIEKTHVLFMNAHFKPFASLGYEYNKVRPSSGTVSLNTTVQFSIPQFGDFFHDMVLHVRLGAVTASTSTHAWRWCAYPGERLIEKVRFTVNGNPLDEYYSQDYSFMRQFELPLAKRPGYWRCVGQQDTKEGTLVQGNSTSTAAPSNDLTADSGAHRLGSSVAAAVPSGYSFKVNVTTGYQTLKTAAAHATEPLSGVNNKRTDILEVTMPLLLWFNRDPRLAIPSVSIPFGQRFIEIDFTSLSNLCGGMPVLNSNNAVASPVVPDVSGATLSIAGPEVTVCDLYVNNIFVNPEVHDIFIKRIGFNLIRVHKRQVNRITTASQEILLNNFKWPIEHIYFGFRPAAQCVAPSSNSAWSQQYADGWCEFSSCKPVRGALDLSAIPTAATTTTQTALLAAQWLEKAPLVQTVSFKAQGVPIYNDIPAVLYNQYLPFVFGDGIVCPTDPGAYCVTFNLHPGVYQPSGHINVSRAREFYIEIDDTTPTNAGRNVHADDRVGGANNATTDLMATASCLNFLLISDGSAVLRYST